MAKTSKKSTAKRSTAKKAKPASKASPKKKADAPLMELFEHGLKDIYWAENALTKAIPKMMKKAVDGNLRNALEDHLKVTKNQAENLKQVFASIDKPARGKKCTGIEGIIKEGEELMEEFNNNLIDGAIIAAASKVEHYEMSSYMTLITLADELKLTKAKRILQEILKEEMEADEVLQNLASNSAGLATERM